MKSLLLIAAMSLGTAAFAQQPSGNTVPDPSMSMGPRGITQQGTNPEGQACTPQGFNMNASAYPPCSAMTPMPANIEDYPPCTKQNADRCRQTYERGIRRR